MPDVTISYKGNSIATMSASGTKTLLTEGKYCEDDITVAYTAPTPSAGSATTPATTITANPTITVSTSGLITATASTSKSITPTVVAGYVSSGTAGTVTVSGSNTSQLTTKGATTYTPDTTDQTITSGQYLTGAQTILGSGNLLAENIKDGVDIFGVIGTYTGGGGGGGPYVVGVVPQGKFTVNNAINQSGATVTVSYAGTSSMPLPPMSQLVVADVNETVLIVLKGGGMISVGETYTFTMPSESVVIMYSGGM